MQKMIEEQLGGIERRENMEILLAAESGSHA